MKSANGKMAKHAALAFVKRTLERCQEYQETGKSCFNEPLFRDIFISGCSQLGDVQAMDSIADGESGKHEVRPSGTFLLMPGLQGWEGVRNLGLGACFAAVRLQWFCAIF